MFPLIYEDGLSRQLAKELVYLALKKKRSGNRSPERCENCDCGGILTTCLYEFTALASSLNAFVD